MRRQALTLVVLALLPVQALAGGYYLPDRGVRAFSRGGAFLVGNDDLSALWYNPATLAGQPGTRIHLDGAIIDFSLEHQRSTIPEIGEAYPSIENAAPVLPDPSLALSSDFGLEDFVFALGAYGPYTGLCRYPELGPERYALVRSDNFGYFLEAAAAWEPTRGFRVGAGFALATLKINNTMVASSFPGIFGGPEDRDQDGLVQYIAEAAWVPTGMVGVWLAPGAWTDALTGLELGLSFMPQMHFAAEGKLRSRLPDHYYYDGVTLDPAEPPVKTSFDFPWVVRAGIRYNHEVPTEPGEGVTADGPSATRSLWDVELDFVWEGWSVFDTLVVETIEPAYYRDVPAVGDYLVLPLVLERKWRDTWSLRLGGQYNPLEWLTIRLGGYYETGAAPDAYYSVATSDADKIGVALGVGFRIGAWELDAGYMHVFQMPVDVSVEEARLTQVNPSNPEASTYVNAGSYESSYDVFGLSILVRVSDWF
jgi:long-chain fatty acid transport protein